MESNYHQQLDDNNYNNYLIPFTISDDCPLENRETIHKILINLKNNFFKETKHIQKISIHRSHLAHYLPVILLGRDQLNKNYIFSLTNENKQKRIYYNFQNDITLPDMLKTFLKRHEESQDRTKLAAIPTSTYELLRNTSEYLNEHQKPIHSVNDKLRNDITNYNNWLTRIIELKTELKLATLDVVQIISEFTFLFWLDNFEHINEKRKEFGIAFRIEIEKLNEELKQIWNSEYYSPYFESTLKVCSDSINYIQGLDNYIQILDQGQMGSTTFNQEHFTKTRDITVELPENIKFFFAKTPFTNNLECKYSVCNNPNDENTDRTHYPVLANIHNNYFEINIDKNTYNPISYEKYNTETKTNLIPKYKPKIRDWQ